MKSPKNLKNRKKNLVNYKKMRKRGQKISKLTPHHTLLEYGELPYWVSFESPSKTEQDDISHAYLNLPKLKEFLIFKN